MRPLAENPLVMGADLRNEPRGLWGTLDWDYWATAAEKAMERLLDINPNWLMIVEGISSANDLSGVRERPVKLSRSERVVYSAHVYKWSGWGQLSPYSERSYSGFAAAMNGNWAYLLTENIAPVWVGEFGTPGQPSAGDHNYWSHLVQFLATVDASWSYWALNARKPDGEFESYGLVGDAWDWQSVRWDARLKDLRRLGLIVGP
jgi:endoglucanase